jgi:hypothetical protein
MPMEAAETTSYTAPAARHFEAMMEMTTCLAVPFKKGMKEMTFWKGEEVMLAMKADLVLILSNAHLVLLRQ